MSIRVAASCNSRHLPKPDQAAMPGWRSHCTPHPPQRHPSNVRCCFPPATSFVPLSQWFHGPPSALGWIQPLYLDSLNIQPSHLPYCPHGPTTPDFANYNNFIMAEGTTRGQGEFDPSLYQGADDVYEPLYTVGHCTAATPGSRTSLTLILKHQGPLISGYRPTNEITQEYAAADPIYAAKTLVRL